MRHRKRDTFCAEFAIDESQRRRIAAPRAIDTSHLIPPNGELIDVRVARIGSPSAAVIVGVLCGGDLCNTQKNDEREKVFHVKPPVGRKYSPSPDLLKRFHARRSAEVMKFAATVRLSLDRLVACRFLIESPMSGPVWC